MCPGLEIKDGMCPGLEIKDRMRYISFFNLLLVLLTCNIIYIAILFA